MRDFSTVKGIPLFNESSLESDFNIGDEFATKTLNVDSKIELRSATLLAKNGLIILNFSARHFMIWVFAYFVNLELWVMGFCLF